MFTCKFGVKQPLLPAYTNMQGEEIVACLRSICVGDAFHAPRWVVYGDGRDRDCLWASVPTHEVGFEVRGYAARDLEQENVAVAVVKHQLDTLQHDSRALL
jgi:hypothetical protein